MTYADSGVDYKKIDLFKRESQQAAKRTASHLMRRGFVEVDGCRGESAYEIETKETIHRLSIVIEGIGTKPRVADVMREQMLIAEELQGKFSGRTFYDQLAQSCAATVITDDLIRGHWPLVYATHLSAWSDDWFDEVQRWRDYITGTVRACDMGHFAWGPGETQVLPDMLMPGVCLLNGATVGCPGFVVTDEINQDDVIVMVQSFGIQDNGLSLSRKIAKERLGEKGFFTEVPGTGRCYGEVLLDPSHIYVDFFEACHDLKVEFSYIVYITGHGWGKIMRHPLPYTYVIDRLPPVDLPIFEFMIEHGPIGLKAAYSTFNMKAAFALILPKAHVRSTLEAAAKCDVHAWEAGHIETSPAKKVVIDPLNIELDESYLNLRG